MRIDNGRKRNNLRDNIFAVTQMLEIVGLSCFYKTSNLHRFHTETSYHLVLRLSKTSKYATRKYINILTPGMPPNSFSHSSDCKVCARVGDLRFWIADFGLWNGEWEMGYWSDGIFLCTRPRRSQSTQRKQIYIWITLCPLWLVWSGAASFGRHRT